MMKCVVLRTRVSAWINTSHWICLISLFNLMCFVHLSLCMRYVCVWLFPYLFFFFLFFLFFFLFFWWMYFCVGGRVGGWVCVYVCVCTVQACVCVYVCMFEATCGPSFRWNFRISHNLNGQRQTTHFSDYDRCFRLGFLNDSVNLDSVASPVYDNVVAIAVAIANLSIQNVTYPSNNILIITVRK